MLQTLLFTCQHRGFYRRRFQHTQYLAGDRLIQRRRPERRVERVVAQLAPRSVVREQDGAGRPVAMRGEGRGKRKRGQSGGGEVQDPGSLGLQVVGGIRVVQGLGDTGHRLHHATGSELAAADARGAP